MNMSWFVGTLTLTGFNLTSIFWLCANLIFAGTFAVTAFALPVFPGAVGFGSESFGGSGRHLPSPETRIFKVSSLKDKGPGSLRECVEANQPRVCLFEISGQIQLQKNLTIKNPYLTIAGHTAPEPGIRLMGAGLIIEANHVLVQHIEIRVGDLPTGPNPNARDGLRLGSEESSVSNIMVDHISVSWALDENVSTTPNLQLSSLNNSIIAEALDASIHRKGSHSKGALINNNTKQLSMISNLIAMHIERNPYIKPGSSVQFLNNVVYGWGGKSKSALFNLSDVDEVGDATLVDFAGNSYLQAPFSTDYAAVYGKPISAASKIHVGENVAPTRRFAAGDRWDVVDLPTDPYQSSEPLFSSTSALSKEPLAAQAHVFSKAGSRPKKRNSIDSRIVNEVRDQQGSIKDCIEGCDNNVGGWPKMKMNFRQLAPPQNPNADDDKNGYTNLEDWIFGFLKEVS